MLTLLLNHHNDSHNNNNNSNNISSQANDAHRVVRQALLTGLQLFLSHPRLMTATATPTTLTAATTTPSGPAPVESQRLAVLALVSALYPALLMSLATTSSSSTIVAELESTTIQLLFTAGAFATSLQGPAHSPTPSTLHFVTLLVPALCDYLMKHIGTSVANGDDLAAMNHGVGPGPAVSACGHGLTHLAQTSAEPFRNVVANLPVAHRGVLQVVMRYALQHPTNQPRMTSMPVQQSTIAPSSTSFATFNTTTATITNTTALPPPSSSTSILPSPPSKTLPPLAPISDTNKLPPIGRSTAPNKLGFDISKFKSVAPVKPTQPAYTFKREVFTAKVREWI